MDQYSILVKPHVTEKTMNLIDNNNELAFVVNRKASKAQIKKAFETRFEEDVVDESILFRFRSGEVEVAVDVLGDLFDGLAGAFGENLVERLTIFENLVGLDFDVGDLSADAAPRLVNHDLRMLERVPFPLRSPREQDGAAACGEPDAVSGDGAGKNLHRVVNRKGRAHAAAGRVDIEINVLATIDALKV